MTHATKAIYRWLLSDYVKVRYTKALEKVFIQTLLFESFIKIQLSSISSCFLVSVATSQRMTCCTLKPI